MNLWCESLQQSVPKKSFFQVDKSKKMPETIDMYCWELKKPHNTKYGQAAGSHDSKWQYFMHMSFMKKV